MKFSVIKIKCFQKKIKKVGFYAKINRNFCTS